MNSSYERDLDLNLLRVFVVVARAGSVTRAAEKLYLTQPAVSAALRRLTASVGAPLFVRHGRGLALTTRGTRLLEIAEPSLRALTEATRAPVRFDPMVSDRTIRLGLSDAAEGWILAPLLRRLERGAPSMRVVALSVQFRTVGALLDTRAVDAAVTVADELSSHVRRRPLYTGGFVALFDGRRLRVGKRLTERAYLEHDHLVVSYNGDLRGIVEDLLGKERRVRCSVSSFAGVGAVLDDSRLVATVPEVVAREIQRTRPHLQTATLPFELGGTPVELLWPAAVDDDPACRFVREELASIAAALGKRRPSRGAD